jgi:hypothetical protein
MTTEVDDLRRQIRALGVSVAAELIRLPSSRLVYSRDGVDLLHDDVDRESVIKVALRLKRAADELARP